MSLLWQLNPKSILVLDDESDIVFTFKRSLEVSGFPVYGFTDPHLALEHFRDNATKYAVIVADVRMPGMNGIEFASKVRRLSRRVKILLMSAFDLKDLSIEPSLQISGLLQKPLSQAQLKEVIAKYVEPNHSSESV